MWAHLKVNLTDILFSVSETMDLPDPSLVDHQVRTAYIASELARAANLDHELSERLFMAAMLHDIGALSPEEKIGVHVAEDLFPGAHCLRGGKLFREAFWLAPAGEIVDWHHTPISQHQKEGRSFADDNVLAAQFLLLADHLERWIDRRQFILHQSDRLRTQVSQLSGDILHPDVIQLLRQVSTCEDFWLELVSKDLALRLQQRCPLRSIDLDFEAARAIAVVLKDITDFRSRFTASHSSGVAACARSLAQRLAFSGKDLQQIEIAGFLHDVGKLVVPNAILCKPERLTAEEYAIIRQHPFYTYRVLSRVRGFEQIAEWASYHHERLNGSGYPGRLERNALDVGAKIVAVADVASAIAESRPYRDQGNKETVISALRNMSAQKLLEPVIVEALTDDYDEIVGASLEAQAEDERRYQERYMTIT